MDMKKIIMDSLYDKETDMMSEGILSSPLIAFLCTEDIEDYEFEKFIESDVLSEDIIKSYSENFNKRTLKKLYKETEKEVKQEKKAVRRNKVSDVTKTDYRLSTNQKRFLKLLKKKYGRALLKEIREYKREILAPYQVIKKNMDKSKALYSKDVLGMSKEEYLRARKSAEKKIFNKGQDKYTDLHKDYSRLSKREEEMDKMDLVKTKSGISKTALNKVFKRYGIYSYRFEDSYFTSYEKNFNDLVDYVDEIKNKAAKGLDAETSAKLKSMIDEVKKQKSDIISSGKTLKQKVSKEVKDALDKLKDTQEVISSIEIKINNDKSLPKEDKEDILKNFENATTPNGTKVTSKSFADEYEMYLMRRKVEEDIKNNIENKFTSEYDIQLKNTKDYITDRKSKIVHSMASNNTVLNDKEKEIYELIPGRPKDSDKLKDYELKIKLDDFKDSKFYSKSEEMKEAEKELDKIIKRFERGLKNKISEQDYNLLKKYRLINNLLVVKSKKE